MYTRAILSSLATVCLLSMVPCAASGGTVTREWANPNYALCEGAGVTASGRVQAIATVDRKDGYFDITSLSLVTSGHQQSYVATGTIEFKNASGEVEEVTLEEPWYETIGKPNAHSLVLPRVQTSEKGPGPWEQQAIKVPVDHPIEISLTLVFTVSGDSCPTKFSTSWKIVLEDE